MTTRESRPDRADGAAPGTVHCVRPHPNPPDTPSTLNEQLRRRRAASLRCEPLPDGRRDPLDRLSVGADGPATFGLSARELLAEAQRCRAAGCQRWEVAARLIDPRTLAVPSASPEPSWVAEVAA